MNLFRKKTCLGSLRRRLGWDLINTALLVLPEDFGRYLRESHIRPVSKSDHQKCWGNERIRGSLNIFWFSKWILLLVSISFLDLWCNRYFNSIIALSGILWVEQLEIFFAILFLWNLQDFKLSRLLGSLKTPSHFYPFMTLETILKTYLALY